MEIYKEIILDHYRNPRNFGIPENMKDAISIDNPSCGDTISLALSIEKGVLTDIRFSGSGCAISLAGASLLTQALKEKSLEEVTSFSKDAMLSLLGVEIGPARMKCALLALEAFQKALQKHHHSST